MDSRLNHAFAHSSVNIVGNYGFKVLAAAGDWHCMGGGSATSAYMHPNVDVPAQAMAECPGTPKLPLNGSRYRHPCIQSSQQHECTSALHFLHVKNGNQDCFSPDDEPRPYMRQVVR